VARATARKRRSSPKLDSSASRRILEECVGVALLGLALLALLALATYSDADPVLENTAVANRAGIAGAFVAAALLRTLGYGAVVAVAGTAIVGLRLVLGRPLPPLASRFWVSLPLLLVSIASLGPILTAIAPSRVPEVEAGLLGSFLAANEMWLLGT